jgi:hypothetical protein
MCAMLHLSFSGVENLDHHLDCRQTPSSQTRGPRESYDPALGASAAATRTRSPLAMAKRKVEHHLLRRLDAHKSLDRLSEVAAECDRLQNNLATRAADRDAPALPGRLAPTTLQQKPA